MLLMPNSTARNDPIHLSDAKLETGPVVRRLLDIVYTSVTTCIDDPIIYAVLDLAEKWDFDHVRHAIRRDLPHDDTDRNAFHHFMVAM
jgi:hypothetical protein